jgi:Tfp pilus assembly protein PilN
MTPTEAPPLAPATPAPASPGLRKFLAIGTGVALEIGRDDLFATVARVRPSGVTVLGSLTIHRFREQRASEWGHVYATFLRKLGQSHLAAHVLLPRDAVIVRQIQLPGVADKDLAAALRFQIDSLHPYPEDDVISDFARIGKTSSILVGIGRRSVVNEYATLFAEAGVKITSFTFAAANLYSAVRMLAVPPPDGFLALGNTDNTDDEGELEAYGESPSHPLFTARLDQSFERARSMALSELRLPPDTEQVDLAALLPKPLEAPEDYSVHRTPILYATAMAGACPWLALSSNLLPVDLRKQGSRWMYVPTIVLAVITVLMMAAVFFYPSWEDRRYLAKLNEQIALVQKRAQYSIALDKKIQVTRNKAQSLDNFRKHLKDDMNAIDDLTNLLTPPSWLNALQLTRDSASISGEADRAEALLKILDSSKQFRRSEFTLPITRGPNGEMFSIHSVREGVTP